MKSRRTAGIAALGAAAALMLAPSSASADETTVDYAAQAAGQALDLQLFGNQLTIGKTVAGLDSTVSAAAQGVGLATPLADAGVSSASSTGDGSDGSTEPVCDDDALPEIDGLSLGLACSSSYTSIVDGLPTAVATGGVATIGVSPLQPVLNTQLGEIVGQVEENLQPVVEGLATLTGAVDDATGEAGIDLGLEDTVQTVIDEVFSGAELVNISLGQTVTEVTAGDVVTGTCTANGGRIDLLGPAGGTAVMSLIVGSSGSSVEVVVADGAPTASFDPAIVTVLIPTMGIETTIGPGTTQSFDLGPLGTSTIAVADGATGVDENGQTFARADAVRIDLLQGADLLGDTLVEGINLSLAGCTSVAGAVTTVTPTPVATPEQPRLPKTGGGMPSGLLVAAAGLGGLGLASIRRFGASLN